MKDQRRLPLRILYTINSSPQYILARSSGPVAVYPIHSDAAESQPYASVSFKTCLETICRSSPELMQDISRDFSVYVLDPLESNSAPAPMQISSSHCQVSDTTGNTITQQPRGVAVGMGLMSWALSTDESDSMTVVGTLGKTGAGQEALEVIFAMRETAAMDKKLLPMSSQPQTLPRPVKSGQSLPTTICPSALMSEQDTPFSTSTSNPQTDVSTSQTTLATIASIQMRTKSKVKPKKMTRVSSTPVTESDKLLSADTYIGPLKKKGRPKGQASADTKVKTEETTPSIPKESPPSSQDTTICLSAGTTPVQRDCSVHASTSNTSAPSPSSGTVDLMSLLALFSTSQIDSVQNAALLAALSVIDAPADQNRISPPDGTNPALLGALRQLLTICTNFKMPNVNRAAALNQNTIPSTTTGSDEDIVFLDKENVDPVAFRRRNDQSFEDVKRGNSKQMDSPSQESITSQQSGKPAQPRGLGARFIENSPPKQQPPAPNPPSANSSVLRKRTLSEFMDERENSRKSHKSRSREKERHEKKDHPRFFLNQQQNYESRLRHYPQVLASTLPLPRPGINSYYRTGFEPWTSPPRPQKIGNVSSKSPNPDILGGTSRQRPIVIPDSPQASRVSASSPIKPTARSRKPYKVPAWAQTNTATQPRLSEQAQRALELAEQKRKEERKLNRRKSNAAAQERVRLKSKSLGSDAKSGSSSDTPPPNQVRSSMSMPPPQPFSATGDLPIIAAADDSLFSFPTSSHRMRSPSPTPRSQAGPPVTPKRLSRITSSTPITDYEGDSLFTPISIARRSRGTASPLISPDLFGSPLARKTFKLSSPTSYRNPTRQPGSESSTITVKVADTNIQSKSTASTQDEAEDDLDCPPSSLPIASSDIDIDETLAPSSSKVDTGTDEVDHDEMLPKKQHWDGLPPSSPPLPTSPALMPMDDEMGGAGDDTDDTDLPLASEGEDELTRNESLDIPVDYWTPAPVNDLMVSQDDMLHNVEQKEGCSEDILDDFVNMETGGVQLDNDAVEALFRNGLGNMDLTEFWETFKPLLQSDGTANINGLEQDFDFNLSGFEAKEGMVPLSPTTDIDHTKLAEDVQTLFSGCLV